MWCGGLCGVVGVLSDRALEGAVLFVEVGITQFLFAPVDRPAFVIGTMAAGKDDCAIAKHVQKLIRVYQSDRKIYFSYHCASEKSMK